MERSSRHRKFTGRQGFSENQMTKSTWMMIIYQEIENNKAEISVKVREIL